MPDQAPPEQHCGELADLWTAPMDFGLRRVAVSRRTSDLVHRGLIRRSIEPRACNVGSKPGKPSLQHTWEAL